MIEDEGIELSGPPLKVLRDAISDMTDDGEMGSALEVVVKVVAQTIEPLESALTDWVDRSSRANAGDQAKKILWTLRSLLDPKDDTLAQRRYRLYTESQRRKAGGGFTVLGYSAFYAAHIAPAPPVVPSARYAELLATIGNLGGTPEVLQALQMAWRGTRTREMELGVVAMAELLLKAVADE